VWKDEDYDILADSNVVGRIYEEFSRHAAGVALVLVDHRDHPGPPRGDARPRARLDEAKTKFRDNWTKAKAAHLDLLPSIVQVARRPRSPPG
jgi:hypothetical protein